MTSDGSLENSKLIFNDSKVTITDSADRTGIQYTFNNSVVNLLTDIGVNKYLEYTFDKLVNGENTTYEIDVDLAGFVAPDETEPAVKMSDTLTVGEGSEGAVVLSDINTGNTRLNQYVNGAKMQILTNATDKFYLALSEGENGLANRTWNYNLDNADHKSGNTINVNFDDFLGIKGITVGKYSDASLANDSIIISNVEDWDVLRQVNTYTVPQGSAIAQENMTRNFNFQEAGTYVAKDHTGVTTDGTINIIGYVDSATGEKVPPQSIISK